MMSWVHRRNSEHEQALTTPSGIEVSVGPSSRIGLEDNLELIFNQKDLNLPHHWTRIDKITTSASDEWIALCFTQIFPEELGVLQSFTLPVSSVCYLLDVASFKVRAKLFFDGSGRLSPRLQNGTLTLCDDRGRVVVLDLASGAVLRNLCI